MLRSSTLYSPGARGARSTQPQTRRSAAREPDTDAIVKYGSAVVIQMAGLTAFLCALDRGVALSGLDAVPFPATFALFLVLALKTRTFNPLNNRRPDLEKAVAGETEART